MSREDIKDIEWKKLISGVPTLCEDIKQYQEELKSNIGESYIEDIRYQMLGAMRDEYSSALWVLAGSLIITKDDQRINEFGKLVDQIVDKKKIQVVFSDYYRLTAITRIYFNLDHLLKVLAESVSGSSKRNVYGNAKIVQSSLSLAESDIDSFSAMGFTRNAFHNNGVHSGDPRSYTLAGKHFNFTDSSEVALSWEDLNVLISEVIKTIKSWCEKLPNNQVIK